MAAIKHTSLHGFCTANTSYPLLYLVLLPLLPLLQPVFFIRRLYCLNVQSKG